MGERKSEVERRRVAEAQKALVEVLLGGPGAAERYLLAEASKLLDERALLVGGDTDGGG